MSSNALAKIQQEPSRMTIGLPKLNGKWDLKKLTEKHKTIVALHAQGVGRYDIGKVAGCTPEYVSMIVAQPLAKEYLAHLQQYLDSRMMAMYSKSVDAISRGLDSDDEEIQLKAARLQMEAAGKLKQQVKDTGTAEDVVAQILAKAQNVIVANNVQINQSGE